MPTGSWVDETFANGNHAAEDPAAAAALQSAPATWQPSSVHVVPKVSRIRCGRSAGRELLQQGHVADIAQRLLRWLMATLPCGCLSGEGGGGGAVVGAVGNPRRSQLGCLLHARGRVHGRAQPQQRQQRLPAAGQVGVWHWIPRHAQLASKASKQNQHKSHLPLARRSNKWAQADSWLRQPFGRCALPDAHTIFPGALTARFNPTCQLGRPASRPLLHSPPARRRPRRCQGPAALQHSRHAGSRRLQSRGLERHPSTSTSHSRRGSPQARSFLHPSHSSSSASRGPSRSTGSPPRPRQSLRHLGETSPRRQQHSTARQPAQRRRSSACRRARVPSATPRQQEAEAAARPAPQPRPRSRSQPAHVTIPQQQQGARLTRRQVGGSSARARQRQPPLPPPSGRPRGQIQRGVQPPRPAARRRSEAARRWQTAARRQQHQRRARARARLRPVLLAQRPSGLAADPWAAPRPLQLARQF